MRPAAGCLGSEKVSVCTHLSSLSNANPHHLRNVISITLPLQFISFPNEKVSCPLSYCKSLFVHPSGIPLFAGTVCARRLKNSKIREYVCLLERSSFLHPPLMRRARKIKNPPQRRTGQPPCNSLCVGYTDIIVQQSDKHSRHV